MSANILKRIHDVGIVAIVRLDSLVHAVDLSRALVEGGVTTIEFTLTNSQATQAITEVKSALGDACLVGAGSVIDVKSVDAVHNTGAEFVVTPVMLPDVIERSQYHGLPVMPGAYTPTEIQTAWQLGASAVKVFPARDLGPTYIKDVLAPLPHLRLMPTGGISINNIGDYLRAGAFAVGVGNSRYNSANSKKIKRTYGVPIAPKGSEQQCTPANQREHHK